jgi:hypothetical protein
MGLQGSMLSKNSMKKRGASENNNKNGSNSNYDIAENPINLVVNDRRAHSKNEKYDDASGG